MNHGLHYIVMALCDLFCLRASEGRFIMSKNLRNIQNIVYCQTFSISLIEFSIFVILSQMYNVYIIYNPSLGLRLNLQQNFLCYTSFSITYKTNNCRYKSLSTLYYTTWLLIVYNLLNTVFVFMIVSSFYFPLY